MRPWPAPITRVFDLLPRALVLTDELEALRTEFDHVWSRIEAGAREQRRRQTWCGRRIYIFRRKTGGRNLPGLPGADVEHLEIERSDDSAPAIPFHSQPTPRFHGSVPAMLEEVKKLIADSKRVLIAVPNTGEVERLADIFSEYAVSFRLGSRTRSGESYADETSYFSGELLTATLAKAYVPDGVMLARREPLHSGRARFVRRVGCGGLSSRSGTNPRLPHFFPISATCRWAITSSTSSTASGSIRD